MTQPFCFPLPAELSNDRIKLIPFDPSHHASTFFSLAAPQQPQIFAHMNAGPFESAEQFVQQVYHGVFQPSPTDFLFAIIDKTRPAPPRQGSRNTTNGADGDGNEDENEDGGSLAGIVAYEKASTAHLSIEIGGIVILPPFQRTHVTTNAVGLLLQYALNPPSPNPTTTCDSTSTIATPLPGLGLARVEWQCNSANAASKRFASRLGFRYEGTLRCARLFRDGVARGKVGNGRRGVCRSAGEGDLARDSDVWSVCWDDWEDGGGVGERVRVLMER